MTSEQINKIRHQLELNKVGAENSYGITSFLVEHEAWDDEEDKAEMRQYIDSIDLMCNYARERQAYLDAVGEIADLYQKISQLEAHAGETIGFADKLREQLSDWEIY